MHTSTSSTPARSLYCIQIDSTTFVLPATDNWDAISQAMSMCLLADPDRPAARCATAQLLSNTPLQ